MCNQSIFEGFVYTALALVLVRIYDKARKLFIKWREKPFEKIYELNYEVETLNYKLKQKDWEVLQRVDVRTLCDALSVRNTKRHVQDQITK